MKFLFRICVKNNVAKFLFSKYKGIEYYAMCYVVTFVKSFVLKISYTVFSCVALYLSIVDKIFSKLSFGTAYFEFARIRFDLVMSCLKLL